MKTTLNILISKEWKSFASAYTMNRKTGKRNKKGIVILLAVLALLVLSYLSFLYGKLAYAMANPFYSMNLGKQYFFLLSTNALSLGFIFCTLIGFALLYDAKDNNFLFSMPVKPVEVLLSRMISCYITALILEAPALITMFVFWATAAGSNLLYVIKAATLTFTIPLCSLILANFASHIIAILSSNSTNKSGIRTVFTLILTIAYSAGFSTIMKNQELLIQQPQITKNIFAKAAHIGIIAAENTTKSLILYIAFTVLTVLIFILQLRIMSSNYIKTITNVKSKKSKKFTDKQIKSKSITKSLLSKELKHLLHTPIYMLNACLGLFTNPILAVVILIKAKDFQQLTNMIPAILGPALCIAASMTTLSTSAVSLEGKNIFILQSMPVRGKTVLHTKLVFHNIFSMIPLVILWICTTATFKISATTAVSALFAGLAYSLFCSCLGLTADLKTGSSSWTSEQYVVKQSPASLIGILSNLGTAVAVMVLYFLAQKPNPDFYNIICATIFCISSMIMLKFINRQGSEIFAYF